MSAIKAIYNAKREFYVDDHYCDVYATIQYNGKLYRGSAALHPEDANFFSEKVGKTIALSRARQAALKDEITRAEEIAKVKYQMYQEVIAYGSKPPAEVDPTGAFLKNTIRALDRVGVLRGHLLSEQASLEEYLKAHKEALGIVKKMRAEQVKDN